MAYLFILCAVALVLLYNGFVRYQRLARNISLAKATGLPYRVSPIDTFGVYWLATRHLWLSLLHRLLPQSCKGLWLDLLNPEWAHRVGHKPFAEAGSDVFFMASPGRLTAFVADAEVIAQITTRRNDFPKPLEMYGRLDLFGKNLVSTEGADWRMHRKLTAPSFGERNNELVFSESVHNTQSLLRLWTGPSGTESRVVADPAEDIMRWALYIISGAGFDIQVTWPHEEGLSQAEKTNDDSLVFKGLQIPPGHKMNYRDALSELLNNIVWSFMGPPEYLSKSPFKAHRAIGTAMMEWRQYMEEIFQMKKDQVASGQGAHGMDLFQSLIRGSGILEGRNTNVKKSDIIGNAFVLMLAGHETTSNTLHYALIYLAMHWSSQKRLQEEIDQAIQGRPTQDWKYDELISKLFNGMPAAVMNETLRIITPINNIPKSTAPGCPQEFTMGGRRYTMPGGTHVSLSAAVHTNPKYWPAPKGEEVKNGIPDVLRFRPERWLANSQTSNDSVNVPYDDEDLGGSSGEDTSSLLFKPVKGSFIPFSDGFRSCIGRRFSQVEFLAAFAVIFSRYSVELAVDQWVSDAELEKMPEGGKEREAAWKKAADRAWRLLRENTDSVITLQLRGHTIPIRLVERGHEMLKFDY